MLTPRAKSILRRLLPRGIRPYPILRGPLRGRKLTTSWHDYPGALLGWTEIEVLAWLGSNVRPGDTWLDVGAHYGYVSLALSQLVGQAGRVFAFEPLVETAGYLSRTRRLNHLDNLVILPLGLGNPDSIQCVTTSVVRGMAEHVAVSGGQRQHILIARLDSLWSAVAGHDSTVHGIKIDVQGMESEVIRGMLNLLRSHRPKLIVELHGPTQSSEVDDLIRDLGYNGGTSLEGSGPSSRRAPAIDKSYLFIAE